MSNRVSALTHLLGSPFRILALVLLLVFTVEVAVMFVLPYLVPQELGGAVEALLDAVLLTLVCAPLLWWVIIGPLRKIAIQEQQRSENVVSNAGEGILTLDAQLNIVSCNPAAERILGVSAANAHRDQSLKESLSASPQWCDSLPTERRIQLKRADGETIPVQISVSDYPSETGRLMIAVLRDLTESELAEQEKIRLVRETEALRSQQMTTLAQLATGVAHEIRNPLTSIKMLIQVNRSKFAEEGLPTDDLELVEQEIRRMERSVNGLLDYARPEQSELADFVIQDLLKSTVQLIDGRCQTQGVRLNVDAPIDPLRLFGDASQIRQLLLNLALNSLDAMPNGGSLSISIQPSVDKLEIVVQDTGTGLSESVTDRLFTPFVTTKSNGIGLGLGICKRIAESHQGTLQGRNRSDRGAEFRLTLPLDANHALTANSNPGELACDDC